jgi:hypothetical protein
VIPAWLFDELVDAIADTDELAVVLRDLDGDGGSVYLAAVPADRRARAMQVEADIVHEAVNDAPCECVVPRRSAVPDRCGACLGTLSPIRQWLRDWLAPTMPLGKAGRPKPRPGRQQRSYADVVAEFQARPLCPGETDEDLARRAGSAEARDAFAAWEPYRC